LTIPAGSGNLAGVPRKLRVEYPGPSTMRMETTMTLKWIAQRLKMGVDGHVASCLRKNE
jgi:hypothetical protein